MVSKIHDADHNPLGSLFTFSAYEPVGTSGRENRASPEQPSEANVKWGPAEGGGELNVQYSKSISDMSSIVQSLCMRLLLSFDSPPRNLRHNTGSDRVCNLQG